MKEVIEFRVLAFFEHDGKGVARPTPSNTTPRIAKALAADGITALVEGVEFRIAEMAKPE